MGGELKMILFSLFCIIVALIIVTLCGLLAVAWPVIALVFVVWLAWRLVDWLLGKF